MSAERDQRLEELLVTRATDGLDAAETAELERLLAEADEADPDAFDEAAAWFWVGAGDADVEPPEHVAERARRTLEGLVQGQAEGKVTSFRERREAGAASGGRRSSEGASRLPWAAAAAALVLAVAGWWPQSGPQNRQESLAEAREELIENAPDLVRVEWKNMDHPRAQELDGGYVVWSDELQKGYMTFRGMPDNDPDEHQYQLWVFDAERSDQYPVDGGVFNARDDGGEVIVPIRNKLAVKQAKMFAVTLEPPGGVVVSDRDPILWIAQAGSKSSSIRRTMPALALRPDERHPR